MTIGGRSNDLGQRSRAIIEPTWYAVYKGTQDYNLESGKIVKKWATYLGLSVGGKEKELFLRKVNVDIQNATHGHRSSFNAISFVLSFIATLHSPNVTTFMHTPYYCVSHFKVSPGDNHYVRCQIINLLALSAFEVMTGQLGLAIILTHPLTMHLRWFPRQAESFPLTPLNHNGDSSKENTLSSSSTVMPHAMNVDDSWSDIDAASPTVSKPSKPPIDAHAIIASTSGVAENPAPRANRRTPATMQKATTENPLSEAANILTPAPDPLVPLTLV
ncbi:hypothetical protein EDC04DRAFT_2608832 [Pisolithus marmoratus]|nr:hypothetical protein EDC04DRAFT_2608832 [Pisolithus marmoratus]